MSVDDGISRRRILQGAAAAAAAGLPAMAGGGAVMNERTVKPPAIPTGRWNVREFGAKGDGKTDDTAAFQAALDRAEKTGGGEVFAAPGRYLFRGSLRVPVSTALTGSFQTVPAHNGIRDAGMPKPGDDGTTLMPTAGAGSEEGPAFITLATNSVLKGVTVFYPEQDPSARPKAYPWTVAMTGKNPAVLDTELLNPYNGIDTTGTERHLIRCVHGQPLRRGIKVDQIYDIGRIEDVHWNPWWSMSDPVMKFMGEEGVGFILAKTDWEYMVNCFCIMYSVGFHVTTFKHGPGNTVLTQCGSDVGPVAVLVDDCQPHAGIAFNNSQFMAGIRVMPTNTGPVKFSNCGFWPIPTTDFHGELAGTGHVTYTGCHFADWGQKAPATPCIHARCAGLTVMGCDFMAEGKNQLQIDDTVASAVVVGNRFRGGQKVTCQAKDAQIGFNTAL